MTAADLLFSRPPASSADLVFGETDLPGEVGATITGAFEPLAVAIYVAEVELATISGMFEPLTASVTAQYDSKTDRPLVGSTGSAWQVASTPNTAGATIKQQEAQPSPTEWAAFWQRATGLQPGFEHRLPDVLHPSRVSHAASHQDAARAGTGAEVVSQEADRSVRKLLASAFEGAAAVRHAIAFLHEDGDRRQRASSSTSWREAKPARRSLDAWFQPAAPYLQGLRMRYQDGVPPPVGLTTRPVPPVPPGGCYTPSADLLFSFPPLTAGNLVFMCGDYPGPTPGGPVVVPVRGVYIVINTVSLRRASDNAPVPTFSMSLQIDFESWTWGFSASVPDQALTLLDSSAGPVELLAHVNGTDYRVLAEQLARERTFGRSSVRVTGRGRNAVLDSPYAAQQVFSNTGARTAQQLMGDVLTINGVSLGWSIDWGLTDWLVPAGAFSHQGSYISALQAIAQAAGGYLQPHPTAQQIRVRHRYPAAPWAWASVTPDIVLPAAVVTREAIDWKTQPGYNRVYVAGQAGGILGRVTRQGTAGEVLAPMVTDPLITHADAARQRGIAILGNTGRQRAATLRLPVLAETGVIEPGKFVRYDDAGTQQLGIVRSASVQIDGPENVWQTLGVEIHD